MTTLNDFLKEETGEEWCRELYKVVSQRRSTMFRLISESTRMLLFGNAGGAALIIGLISTYGIGGEGKDFAYHWIALIDLLLFGTGILFSAATTILVALVAIKEAHTTELGLKHFVERKEDRSSVLFFSEPKNIKIANLTTVFGVISASCFVLGGFVSLLLLVLFF